MFYYSHKGRHQLPANNTPRGQVRIIGGNWRRRKISFAAIPDLRPTGDRIRETLFNWLQQDIFAAHCLELYAGSGILSLEALSRGAGHACINDLSTRAIQEIASQLKMLECDAERYSLSSVAADQWIQQYQGPAFDIIFLDPPFLSQELQSLLPQLVEQGISRTGTLIYVEASRGQTLKIPESWSCHRQGHAGRVAYQLFIQEDG